MDLITNCWETRDINQRLVVNPVACPFSDTSPDAWRRSPYSKSSLKGSSCYRLKITQRQTMGSEKVFPQSRCALCKHDKYECVCVFNLKLESKYMYRFEEFQSKWILMVDQTNEEIQDKNIRFDWWLLIQHDYRWQMAPMYTSMLQHGAYFENLSEIGDWSKILYRTCIIVQTSVLP